MLENPNSSSNKTLLNQCGYASYNFATVKAIGIGCYREFEENESEIHLSLTVCLHQQQCSTTTVLSGEVMVGIAYLEHDH